MIEVKFKPDTFTLEVTGHANHGKKGKDIVCAAISTLFYTLGDSLFSVRDMMAEDIVFSDEDGNGYITCKPKPEYEANVSLIYWTILNGFDMVARNYKKNVVLKL